MTVTAEAAQNGRVLPGNQLLSATERQERHRKITAYLDSPQAAGQAVFEIHAALETVSKSAILRQMHKRGAKIGRDGLMRMPGGTGKAAPAEQRGKKGAYLSYDESWALMTKVLTGHRDLTPVKIHELTGVPQSTVYKLLRDNGVMLGGMEEVPMTQLPDGGAVYSPLVSEEETESVEVQIMDEPPLAQQYVNQLSDGRFLGRDERGRVWIWRPDSLL